jgi:uncharacterized protein (DUF4415 family)
MSEERIVNYTAEELERLPSRTDWARLDAMTEEEIEANAASDPDNPPWTEEELRNAQLVMPSGSKSRITMHLDDEVLRYFRRGGRGYQTRMNAVLHAYVRSRTRREQESTD